MTDRAVTIAALESCFADFETLVQDLGDTEWAAQSLCPDWKVRDVVVHLAAIEHALVGWIPGSADEGPPFHLIGPFVDDVAGLTSTQLSERTREILATRRAEIGSYTLEQWKLPCMTPAGPRTLGGFMEVRVFDLWIHQRDMTVPLGRPTPDNGPAAEITADQVEAAIAYIAGKRIGLPDRMSIAFHLEGPVERSMFVRVDGRAAAVGALRDPSVALWAESTTFLLLCAGRIDPQTAIDRSDIRWTGDPEWGDRAARNLRFTI